jgi:quercetin dioxygenase-like cupin family protein
MRKLARQPTVKAPADQFIGDAWYDAIVRGEEPSHIRVSAVRFSPGGRNNWHVHAMGQTLHVLDGTGVVQSRDGEAIVMQPGDTVQTAPGEWHWHGATPDHFMTHLAMWESPAAGGDEITWGDPVSDADYHAAIELSVRQPPDPGAAG